MSRHLATQDLVPVPRELLQQLRHALDETINANVVIQGLQAMVDLDSSDQCTTCFDAVGYCIRAQSSVVCDALDALEVVFPRAAP